MAKDDIDLDNMDLDDFDFDVPEFDAVLPKEGTRSPITRAVKGVVRGTVDNLKDPATLSRALALGAPEGYSLAFDAASTGIGEAKALYDKAIQDSPHLVTSSKKLAAKAEKLIGPILPKSARERLKNVGSEDEVASYMSEAQAREERLNNELGQLTNFFKDSKDADIQIAEQDRVDREEIKVIENVRHKSTTDILQSINLGMARLVGYNDDITQKWQRKSLELQYRQFSITQQMAADASVGYDKTLAALEEIKINTGLPEQVKWRQSELFKQLTSERLQSGMLNTVSNWTSNYKKQITGNISNAISGFTSGFGGMGGMGDMEGMDKAGLSGQMAGSMLSDYLVNAGSMAVSPILANNKKVDRFSDKLTNWFTRIPQKANEWAQSSTDKEGLGGEFVQFIKDLAPRMALDYSPGNVNVSKMDHPAEWDVISRKTLIEVIPGYLSELVHWTKMGVTGVEGERQVYNVTRGGFTSESENLQDISRQVMNRSEREGISSSINDFMAEIGGDTLSPMAQRILKRKILDEVANGRDLVPKRLADPSQYSGDAVVIEEITDLISDTFNLDASGEFVDFEGGLKSFNKTALKFTRMGNMIPAAGDRMRLMADVLGRDNLRKLGYMTRDGREDKLNFDPVWDSIIGGEDHAPSKTTSGGRPNKLRQFAGRYPGDADLGSMASYHDLLAPSFGSPQAGTQAVAKGGEPFSSSVAEQYFGDKSLLITILRESRDTANLSQHTLTEIRDVMDSIRTTPTPVALTTPIATVGDAASTGYFDKVGSYFQRLRAKSPFGKGGKSPSGGAGGGRLGRYMGIGSDLFTVGKGLGGVALSAAGVYIRTVGKLYKGAWNMGTGMLGGAASALRGSLGGAAGAMGGESGASWGDRLKSGWGRLSGSAEEQYGRAVDGAKGLYDKVSKNPKLSMAKLRGGEYYDVVKGKAITSFDEISGDIVDLKTKTLLKFDEMNARGELQRFQEKWSEKGGEFMRGARDKAGNLGDRARSMYNDRGSIFDKAKGMLSNPFAGAMTLAKGGYRKIMGLFDKSGGRDQSKHMTGQSDTDLVTLNLRQTTLQFDILKILKERLPEKRKFNDSDGDGFRDGSWQSKRAKADAEGSDGKDSDKGAPREGILGKLFGKGSLLAGLLGGRGRGGDDGGEDEGGGINIDGTYIGGSDGGKERRDGKGGKGGKGGKRGFLDRKLAGLGKRGLMGRGAELGLRGAGWAASKAGGLAWGATKLVGRHALMPLAGMAGKAMLGLASLVGAPVLIGGAIAAAAAYGGYRLYKRWKSKMPPLTGMRFIQYGISPYGTSDGLDKVAQLEDLFKRHATVSQDGQVKIDTTAIPVEQIASILEFDLNDRSSSGQERFQEIVTWITGRFSQTLMMHLSAANKQTGTMDLSTVDEKVKGRMAVDYLKSVEMADKTAIFDDETGPGGGIKINNDADDVSDYYKEALEKLEEEAEKTAEESDKGSATPIVAAAGAAAAMGATGSKGDSKGGPSEEAASSWKSTAIKMLVPGAGVVSAGLDAFKSKEVSAQTPMVWQSNKRLDMVNPIRYRIYGLTEMAESKVVQLAQLEYAAWPRVMYRNGNEAYITGQDELYVDFIKIFDLVVKDQAQGYQWFEHRFLPAFLSYCSAVRALAPIDARTAADKLSNDQLVSVIEKMSSAVNSEDVSVWDVEASPWSGYLMNNDPKSIDQNVKALKERVATTIIPEAGLKHATMDGQKAANGEAEADKSQTNRQAVRDPTIHGSVTDGFGGAAATEEKPGVMSRFGSWLGFGNDKPKNPESSMASPTGATAFDVGQTFTHTGGGTGGDINSLPMPTGEGWEGSKALLTAAAKMVGVPAPIAAAIAGVESSFNPNAQPWADKKKTRLLSSAKGYYQMINGTWKETMKAHGSKYGINPATTALDPRANALLGLSYIKDNMGRMSKYLGRGVTDTDVYLAHFLGPGGAKRFLTAPPGDPAINHVGADQARANPFIFYNNGRPNTVAEVYNQFSGKLVKHRKEDAGTEAGDILGNSPSAETSGSGDMGSMISNEQSAQTTSQHTQVPVPGAESFTGPMPDSGSSAPLAPIPMERSEPIIGTAGASSEARMKAETADIQSSAMNEVLQRGFQSSESLLRQQVEISSLTLDKISEMVEIMRGASAGGGRPSSNPGTTTPASSSAAPARPLPGSAMSMSRS